MLHGSNVGGPFGGNGRGNWKILEGHFKTSWVVLDQTHFLPYGIGRAAEEPVCQRKSDRGRPTYRCDLKISDGSEAVMVNFRYYLDQS